MSLLEKVIISEFLVLLHNDKALMDCVWFWYVGSFSVFIAVSLLSSAFEHCETSHVRLVQWNSQKTWRFFRSILQSNQRSVPRVQQTFRDGRTGEVQLCMTMPTNLHCMIPRYPSHHAHYEFWMLTIYIIHVRITMFARRYQKHLAESWWLKPAHLRRLLWMTHEQKKYSMNGMKKVIKPQNPGGSSTDIMGIKGLYIQFITKTNFIIS